MDPCSVIQVYHHLINRKAAVTLLTAKVFLTWCHHLFGSQRNNPTSRVEEQHPLFTMRTLWTPSSLPHISQQQRLALNILTRYVYYWPSVLIVSNYFNFTQLVLLFFFGMAVPGFTKSSINKWECQPSRSNISTYCRTSPTFSESVPGHLQLYK